MKYLTLAGLGLAALALSGCNGSSTSTAVSTADNTLAALAKNQIPLACAIVSTAEGYYAAIVPTPAPAIVAAEAGAAIICANPPTDLAAAFAALLQEWTLIQAATSTKAAPAVIVTPSPTPTAN